MTHDLHPQVQALLSGILQPPAVDVPPEVDTFRAANASTSALLGGPGEPVARVFDTTTQTSHGPVDLRWYEPADRRQHSLIVYVHGGGWVAGTLDSYDTLCRALALRTNSRVVSVAYSLSPEALFPTALDQVTDILRQARSLAQQVGLEPIRFLSVAGDSAGGCLIAAAIHLLAEAKESLPEAAVLLYPVTDASLEFASYHRLGTGYSLTTARMRWFWEQYLGPDLGQAGSLLVDPRVSPLHSPNLRSFPPTLVLTAAFDPLHDEGEDFARRLEAAGVAVHYIEVPGQIHGFLRFRQALTDPEWGPDAVMLRIAGFLSEVEGAA